MPLAPANILIEEDLELRSFGSLMARQLSGYPAMLVCNCGVEALDDMSIRREELATCLREQCRHPVQLAATELEEASAVVLKV